MEENPLLETPACTEEPQGHPHCPKPPSVPGAPMAAVGARGGALQGQPGGVLRVGRFLLRPRTLGQSSGTV